MKRAVELQEALDNTVIGDKDLRNWALEDFEWEQMKQFIEFFKVRKLFICF